jgi:RNA polymerase sigma-70 factor (ECF subfamily)
MDVPLAWQTRQDLLRAAMGLAPELTRYLRAKTPDAAEAQDLMQEVYLRLLKIQRPAEIENARAYLFKVAASVAYQHRLRHAAYPQHVTLDEATETLHVASLSCEPNATESAALLAERFSKVEQRLSELSPKVQAAILWHHRDGYTCDEIAEKLSVVTHRVKKYLVKGLTHCRAGSAEIVTLSM